MSVAVSNRARSASLFGADPDCQAIRGGVDTIRLRGPVHPDALDAPVRQNWRRDVDVATGVLTWEPMGGLIPLNSGIKLVLDRRRGRPEACLEASIPRLHVGHNCTPANVGDVRTQVLGLYDDVGRHVEWLCDPLQLDVMRLDLPVDFHGVEQVGTVLRGLSSVPVGQRMATTTYLGPADDGVLTLYRATSRWKTRTYGKGAQLYASARVEQGLAREHLVALAQANATSLRFEVELKADACKQEGLGTVADLLKADLVAINRRYFERTKMGVVVGGGSAKVKYAMDVLRARGQENIAPALLGQLAMTALGYASPSSQGTREKYRRLAKELGILPSDVVEPNLEAMRLDYETGVLLLGDDALLRA